MKENLLTKKKNFNSVFLANNQKFITIIKNLLSLENTKLF